MSLRPLHWRPARYVVVGALCALLNNLIIISGDLAGVHYVLMTLVAVVVVTPIGYWLHSGFTFRGNLSWAGFTRFASGVLAGYPLSLAVMAALTSGLGVPVAISTPVATILLFLWNYASAHWAILGWRRRG
jgi:putative flippase GtrA